MVFRCLLWLCKAARAVRSRRNGLHWYALSYGSGKSVVHSADRATGNVKTQYKRPKRRKNKKKYGNRISIRLKIAALCIEEGHWEADTVVGKRAGKEGSIAK